MSLLIIYPVFSKKGRKFYERGMKKIFFYERGNEFTHDLPCIFKKKAENFTSVEMSLLTIYPVFSKKGRKFYERGMKNFKK